MKIKRPIYKANIDGNENLGLSMISLVENPAVQSMFVCFDEQKPKQLFFSDNSKHIITGVALRADYPIYRRDESGFEYFIVFDANTIEKMVLKYSKDQMLNNVDLQHDGVKIEGVTMIESFIKDVEKGINPKGFEDIEDKSWFVSFKIEDNELWNNIVNGYDLNGLSVECMVNMIPTNLEMSEEKDEINTLIDEILNDKN